MANQYNQQNPDGSWSQVTQNSDGSYTVIPISPSGYAAANIPTGSTPSASSSGVTYPTSNGPKTIAQMTSELQVAGWNGNYGDAASVIAAYNQTASGPGATSATTSSAQALLDAIASGNTQDFNEKVREFNQNYALDQQRLGLDQTTQYGNLASSLLSTASNLRGPGDYYQYENYLHGGKDLMQTLYGSKPLPAFEQPVGTNPVFNIQTLMQQLGIGAPTSSAPTSPVASTAAAVGATPTTPGSMSTGTTPTALGTIPTQTSTSGATLSTGTPSAASGTAATTAATTAAQPESLAASGAAYNWGTPPAAVPTGQGGAPQAPNPWQIDPAVWDSYGPVGQAIVLSAVSANNGDPTEFMRQLNASRPQGTAPRSTSTQFNTSAGAF